MHSGLNSSPNDNISDWSKLKAYADNIIIVTEKLKFVLVRVENIVGKGENVLLFPQCFQKNFLYRVVKSRGLCGKELMNFGEKYQPVSACADMACNSYPSFNFLHFK